MKEIRTKKLRKINEKALIVGVDIGKAINTGYCRCSDGYEVKPFEFYNNGRGFNSFWTVISKIKELKNLDEIVVGFESTGSYGVPLLHYLRARKVTLVQVNPMHTKKLKEVYDNSPNKTDKKDPKVIVDIIVLGRSLTHVVPEGPAAELRSLTHARERSMQRRTALLNQLHVLVFTLFPEFVQVMKGIKSRSARYLLRHYPMPQDIVRQGVEALEITLRKVSRGRLDKERAQALYEGACQSVGISQGRESMLIEIREILDLLETVERFIDKLEDGLAKYLKQIPYSTSILSLRGIGEVTAAGIIGEVADFSKFDTIHEITKLAGLDLFEISSGDHQGRRRISKRGRPLLRKILYYASLNLVRKGGELHETYQRHIEKGMVKTKALIAVARKLLRIIFALVRDHTVFVPEFASIRISKEAA